MFAFSQRFFGEDRNAAKLAFRETFVPRLLAQVVPADDPDWAQTWLVFDSPQDVTTLLPIILCRQLLASRPENVATLIRILCEHLFALLSDPDFPNGPVSTSASPLASSRGAAFLRRSAGSVAGPRGPDLAREALNCIRVLTRVLPCAFERAGLGPPASEPILRSEEVDEPALEPDRFEKELLWTEEKRRRVLPGEGDDRFKIYDEEDEHASVSEQSNGDTEFVALPSLGQRLLSLVIDLLFVVRFTLPQEAVTDQQQDQRIAYVIWEAGIGSTLSIGSTTEIDSNRIEVLRLLLVLLSRSMYVPPSTDKQSEEASPSLNGASSSAPSTRPIDPTANPFLQHLRTWPTRRVALSLLCSLINTAVSTAPSLPVPSTAQSLSNAAASVPLVGSVFSGSVTSPVAGILGRTSEARKELGQLCMLILDVAFVDPPGSTGDNVFRHYISKLHRSPDYAFLATGLLGLISNAATSANSTEGNEAAPGVVEGLVLFWRLLECNPKFLSAILASQSVPPKLLCSLLLICLEQRDYSASIGLVRLCAFLLQALSAERSFAAKVGVPTESVAVRGVSRGRWAVSGTVHDFLIVSLYTLVFTTKGALSSLYPAFTCILINCSPYFKQLSVVSATRLTQLFLAFSAPVFLLAEEDNPRLCFNTLEVFNNVVHHQFSDNPNLIYALIRCHRRFEDLSTFTLSSAVAEIRKARAERESRPPLKTEVSSASLASVTAPSSPTTFDMLDDPFPALSEKARGKMRERSIDRDDGFPGAYTSRTGFVPTAAWVSSWREALPLDSILVLLAELRPRVESLCTIANPSTNQAALDYLRAATLLGLLPPTPALKPRRFTATGHATRWLLSMVWSAAYMRQRAIFGGTRVALFSVQQGAGGKSGAEEVVQAARGIVGALQRRTSMAAGEGRRESATV